MTSGHIHWLYLWLIDWQIDLLNLLAENILSVMLTEIFYKEFWLKQLRISLRCHGDHMVNHILGQEWEEITKKKFPFETCMIWKVLPTPETNFSVTLKLKIKPWKTWLLRLSFLPRVHIYAQKASNIIHSGIFVLLKDSAVNSYLLPRKQKKMVKSS